MATVFKVVISQHRLLHYRLSFFEKLRKICATNNIELTLVHGQASRREMARNDEGSLDWAQKVRNTFIKTKSTDLLWQPMWKVARGADLIVLMQENRILSNYLYLARRKLGYGPIIAYWGHGANFQARNKKSLRERWKRNLIGQVDHWFAYTSATVNILLAADFPRQRITNLNNAVDTGEFSTLCSSVTEQDKIALREAHHIPPSATIGLFCGSLYADKKLPLLVTACDMVRKREPNFHLVVIGTGPELGTLQELSKSRPWLALVGVRRHREKAMWFSTADIMLNPGAVGLHILDSFSAKLPTIVVRGAMHGPEIAYLEDKVTAILCEDNPSSFADAVCGLLGNRAALKKMSAAAGEQAQHYSVDAMVDNFLAGIQICQQFGKR